MAAITAWLLNLDAERELADPVRYEPDVAIEARIGDLRRQLTTLVGADDVVVGVDPPDVVARANAKLVRAWCPTPHALARLAAAGLRHPEAPDLEVLRRVNARDFSAAVGQTIEGARFVHSMPALEETLALPSPTGDWVLKRRFGFAGRERRRAIGGKLDRSTLGFAAKTFARGEGLQAEPWLAREQDLVVHGWVSPDGRVTVSEPVGQRCHAQGSWLGMLGAARELISSAHVEQLSGEGRRVGEALAAASYFGPYGVDAYTYRMPDGDVGLNPRSEINARFTMGYLWPVGSR